MKTNAIDGGRTKVSFDSVPFQPLDQTFSFAVVNFQREQVIGDLESSTQDDDIDVVDNDTRRGSDGAVDGS